MMETKDPSLKALGKALRDSMDSVEEDKMEPSPLRLQEETVETSNLLVPMETEWTQIKSLNNSLEEWVEWASKRAIWEDSIASVDSEIWEASRI